MLGVILVQLPGGLQVLDRLVDAPLGGVDVRERDVRAGDPLVECLLVRADSLVRAPTFGQELAGGHERGGLAVRCHASVGRDRLVDAALVGEQSPEVPPRRYVAELSRAPEHDLGLAGETALGEQDPQLVQRVDVVFVLRDNAPCSLQLIVLAHDSRFWQASFCVVDAGGRRGDDDRGCRCGHERLAADGDRRRGRVGLPHVDVPPAGVGLGPAAGARVVPPHAQLVEAVGVQVLAREGPARRGSRCCWTTSSAPDGWTRRRTVCSVGRDGRPSDAG